MPLFRRKSTQTRWAPLIPFGPIFRSSGASVSKDNRQISRTNPLLRRKGVVFVADQSRQVWSGLGTDWNFMLWLFMAVWRPYIDPSVGINNSRISANDFQKSDARTTSSDSHNSGLGTETPKLVYGNFSRV